MYVCMYVYIYIYIYMCVSGACLVDRAGEALHDVVGLEARRHAHVGRVGPSCSGELSVSAPPASMK